MKHLLADLLANESIDSSICPYNPILLAGSYTNPRKKAGYIFKYNL